MKLYLLSLLILLVSLSSYAEGTLQLITCPTCEAGISLNDKAQFAYPGLTEDRRLHIRIADPANERIYVALSEQWYVRIVSPDGASFYVFDGTGFNLNGTSSPFPNTIANYTENTQGPNGITQAGAGSPTSGSYNSVVFTPNVAGDWYIEFTDQPDFSTPTIGARCQYWDISVVDSSSAANDVINGRLWSYQWGMRSGPGSVPPGPGPRLNSTFYVYTEPEQVVTSIEIGNPANPGWGGDWLIACNRYGIIQSEYNAGNPTEARKSINGNADAIYGALSEYKIFVNDPDINEFPSGVEEITVSSLALDECGTGEIFITFNTNIEGIADIILDFPPYANSGQEDVTFPARAVQAGNNTIAWDRLGGNGNPVADGTPFKIRLFIGGSVVHLPLYDIEGLTGLKARLVRPGTAEYIGLYWDNTNMGGTATIAEPGCLSSNVNVCNNYGYGDGQTLNVWWNGLDTNAEIDVMVPLNPQANININNSQSSCNESGITVFVIGQTQNVNSVQWATSGTGYFDNPNNPNAIYYASAQDSLAGSVLLTLSSVACPETEASQFVSFGENLCSLPITLGEFGAALANTERACDGIKISWQTLTEENTDYFVLERSADGLNFSVVERVQAAGYSIVPMDYVVMDKNVSTKNYYRLTNYDLDGTHESFLLNYVVYTDCFENIDINNISDVFPNPVRETAIVKINIKEAAHVMVNIVDIHGRLVRSIPLMLQVGENLVNFSMADLDAGAYFVSLMTNEWQTDYKKVIKLNR